MSEVPDDVVAAVVAALLPRLRPSGDALGDWRRQRQQALGMRRGA
ncbi:hypothetical protein J2S57_005830 [Kineosporia succinea]|uniref:Uncharacterized protein n=1 Tax=Kineosporia succinea TaxID=84632 RepID=A0ABT9PBK1_9ACTN|nr:hypothetical protein [Kineosporia succinea]